MSHNNARKDIAVAQLCADYLKETSIHIFYFN
jgi:hypothetical protein